MMNWSKLSENSDFFDIRFRNNFTKVDDATKEKQDEDRIAETIYVTGFRTRNKNVEHTQI